MRKYVLILVAAVAVSEAPSVSLGEEKPASEISELVSSTTRAIKNASFTVTWNDSLDGGPAKYAILKTVYDSLGRIRLTEIDEGSYDASGKRVSSRKGRSDRLFDGEKSVVVNTQTDLDEAGKPIPDSKGAFRTAIIADAIDGASKWRTALRNPLKNSATHLLSRMDGIAQLGQTVNISPTKYEGEQAVVVRFKQRGFEVTATLDPNRSWTLRELVQTDSRGRTTNHYRAEYIQSQQGLWLPVRGTNMFLHQKIETPVVKVSKGKPQVISAPSTNPIIQKHESTFELSALVVNDPKFDESVFEISLPVGTLVSDGRFKTRYRIGEAKSTDAELTRLAMRAREHPEPVMRISRDKTLVPREASKFRASALWIILGSLTVVAIVVLAGVTGRRAFSK